MTPLLSRTASVLVALVSATTIPCGASIGHAEKREDKDARPKLPAPLDAIAYDLGKLAEHFKVAQCKLYAEGEFKVGERVVAEETVVWTLEAKDTMKGDAVFRLLHPNKFPDPFAKVRFEKSDAGKTVSADARPAGYYLARDARWINLKMAPDLAAGDKLQVWVHLGQEGSAGLVANRAERMIVVPPSK